MATLFSLALTNTSKFLVCEIFTISIQQDKIICRRLNEVNKTIESFRKYISLNPTTRTLRRN